MIVIAGAGIGGLTLGCALTRLGKPFRILERAAELKGVGAGIALSPNAYKALAHIGMNEVVRRIGWELASAELCEFKGRVLVRVSTPKSPAVTQSMTRAKLHQALAGCLGAAVETGRTVVDYEPVSDGVRVRMADGEMIDAELLVGADGLRSTVRRAMRGDEALRYSGQTSWRGLVSDVEVSEPARVRESWGAGKRFGIVPVGPREIYWFAVANAPAGERDGPDLRRDLRTSFAGWHEPIDSLLARTPAEKILRTDICDRPPIDRWVDGRTVLLGDAAHPMTPDLGMGACQAIEDAVVLADALRRESTIDAVLHRYESRRVARANGFVTRSRRLGQMAHTSSPLLRWLRNRAFAAFGLLPASVISRIMAQGFDFRL